MPRIRSRPRVGVTATAVPAARLTVLAATGTARAADPEELTADGPGAVRPAKGDSATFWPHSRTAGESAVSVDRLGGGRASLSVNGEKVTAVGGVKKGTERVRMFLSGGINKITVIGASGRPALDRLRVAPAGGTLQTEVYQAEDGTLTGAAKVTDAYTFASGGKAVTDIGDGKANGPSVDDAARHAGRHAVTIRYSNAAQVPATHCNPDPIGRHADLSANGEPARRVPFRRPSTSTASGNRPSPSA